MKNDENCLSKSKQLLAASAMVPVVGALSRPTSLSALIYTFFVCAYLLPLVFSRGDENKDLDSDKNPEKTDKQSKSATTIIFALTLVGAGLVSECLAWVSDHYARAQNPALLHTQLFADLLLAFFYYIGLAVAWLLVLRHFQFALKEIFFLTFIVALIKQIQLGTLWAICGDLVTDPLFAIVTLASLFVVSGSISALGFLAGGKIADPDKKGHWQKKIQKYLLTLFLIALLPELSVFTAATAAKETGIYPPERMLIEAPHL